MAFGNLQDSSGTVEVVFFPKVFEAAKDYIVQDRVILVKAKVEVQEDEVKLIAEKVTVPKEEEVEFATDTLAQEIFIPRKTSKETLQKLGKLLKANPGKTNIVIIIPNGGKPERMKLPYGVEWNKTLEEKVAELLK